MLYIFAKQGKDPWFIMERRNKPVSQKHPVNIQLFFFYHCTLPVWSLPPVFFIPIGLMVYFSLCFHLTLFCSREAVVRKPLHWITALLGTWAPSLLHAAACQRQKEPLRLFLMSCLLSKYGWQDQDRRRFYLTGDQCGLGESQGAQGSS